MQLIFCQILCLRNWVMRRSGLGLWFQFHLLLASFRIYFVERGSVPHGTFPDDLFWCVHATAFEVEQNLSPFLWRPAHLVFDRRQPLLTTGRNVKNHNRAKLVILAPKAAVNTVSPDIDDWFIVKICVSLAVVFVGPILPTARNRIR